MQTKMQSLLTLGIYTEEYQLAKFTSNQLKEQKKLYSILSEIGGKELVGNARLTPVPFGETKKC